MTFTTVRYRTAEGCFTGVAGERERKYRHVALMGAPIRMVAIEEAEERYLTGLDTPAPAKAAKRLLKAGRKLGITKAAKTFLKGVA